MCSRCEYCIVPKNAEMNNLNIYEKIDYTKKFKYFGLLIVCYHIFQSVA